MPKSATNPRVDAHFRRVKTWRRELETLRKIILSCGLTEELKWGKPCYTFQGTNLIMVYGLKESCAIAFFNGALLKDARRLLVKPGPNTQAGRWIKFTSLREIVGMESTLKAYIRESLAAEKAGLKVEYKKESEPIPEELQKKFDETPALKTAFAALTPGRQRAYLIYFSAPKQSKTRDSRIEKYRPQILRGEGFHDAYRQGRGPMRKN
jgi:uncharacterized protein YdeI (YjbR/CyaY-like superfamily)